ncbi:MAG: glycoside hydrolase family 2 TIM barrel-domain containing protein [Protaetiibacter sp.]
MSLDLTRVADPRVFAERRRPAHSDHRWFRDRAEAASGTSGYEQLLSGRWRFHYAPSPAGTVEGFEAADFDASGWDEIPVPAHIQLCGYDRPQYANVQYPWDGQEQVEPGEIPTLFNPVASYLRDFSLERPLAPGERVSIVFEGAESAIAVWCNGVYLGYATDSFTPSEFDVTDALVPGENRLAAQVIKWSSGSWLEDQDMYRFSGLFRDVVLRRRPATHVEDLRVTVEVSDDLASAEVRLGLALQGEGTVTALLEGVGELAPAGDGELAVRVDEPRMWSPESPELYELVLEVRNAAGEVTEIIPQAVGIRRFAIEDGLLRLNGRRIVFHGVNRHEFGLDGRVMTREQTEEDLRALKRINVNAIRTSHYPNNSFFYELADRYGFLVIDEMNLETHGMWDRLRYLGVGDEEALPGDRPEWLPALLDRAASMLERDKNHPSVVMWSCGNESYGGTGLREVAAWFRSRDTRPVHYEGVDWDPRYPDTSDVLSRMYTPAREIEPYLATHPGKPLILCEYAHAMGNSFGGVGEYLDLAYREPRFQGGFIWDFADQAIALVDSEGRRYFGYGGDAGESPNDGDFCGNGIFFADHTPSPKALEAAALYQGLVVRVDRESFTVTSRLLATRSSAYECRVTLAREGEVLATATVQTDVAPGETASYPLPVTVPDAPGEYAVEVSFRLRAATPWAEAGHEVAGGQGVFGAWTPPGLVGAEPPRIVRGIHNTGVHGARFHVLFSRLHGGLASYRYGDGADGGRELIRGIVRPNFWHAPTSNERGWGAPLHDGAWLLASRYLPTPPTAMDPVVTVGGDGSVTAVYRYPLPVQPATVCELAYRVDASGRVEVTQTMELADGLPELPEFGVLVTTAERLDRWRWYGDGPAECYVDRRVGARLGVHETDVRTALTPYLRPQEAGSRTGVRWAEVTDERGAGLRFDAAGGMEFSALPWTPDEIEAASHPHLLPPSERTVLRPALMRRGVAGDNSWGARTLPQYRLPTTGTLRFRFGFTGV